MDFTLVGGLADTMTCPSSSWRTQRRRKHSRNLRAAVARFRSHGPGRHEYHDRTAFPWTASYTAFHGMRDRQCIVADAADRKQAPGLAEKPARWCCTRAVSDIVTAGSLSEDGRLAGPPVPRCGTLASQSSPLLGTLLPELPTSTAAGCRYSAQTKSRDCSADITVKARFKLRDRALAA